MRATFIPSFFPQAPFYSRGGLQALSQAFLRRNAKGRTGRPFRGERGWSSVHGVALEPSQKAATHPAYAVERGVYGRVVGGGEQLMKDSPPDGRRDG
jgi:hypothetical protein